MDLMELIWRYDEIPSHPHPPPSSMRGGEGGKVKTFIELSIGFLFGLCVGMVYGGFARERGLIVSFNYQLEQMNTGLMFTSNTLELKKR